MTGVIKTNASSVLLVHQYYMHWLQPHTHSSQWWAPDRKLISSSLQMPTCSRAPSGSKRRNVARVSQDCQYPYFVAGSVARGAFLNSGITLSGTVCFLLRRFSSMLRAFYVRYSKKRNPDSLKCQTKHLFTLPISVILSKCCVATSKC